jgi:hypothetical protein
MVEDAAQRWGEGAPRFAMSDAVTGRFLGQVGMSVYEPYQSAELFY